MRRLLLLAGFAALALAAPAGAATPAPDPYAPPPKAITVQKAHSRITQLDDGAGGLPFLGTTSSYNAGDWEDVLRSFVESGTYDREIGLIDTLANREVIKAGPRRTAKPQAIVLDIDETALSNYSAIDLDDFTFGRNSQAEATEEIGKAIPQTLKLYNDAKAEGLGLFFITGRRENTRAHTESNLRREGYTGWDGVILKPDDSTQTTVQFKTAARKEIQRKWRIVVNVGDQFSDLAGGQADHAFKLPNPFYFLP